MINDIFTTIPTKCDSLEDTTLKACRIKSHLGDLIAVGDDKFLYLLSFTDTKNLPKKLEQLKKALSMDLVIGKSKILTSLQEEMAKYFEGKLKHFRTPVKFVGTDFQKQCWQELIRLPYGDTLTYGKVAEKIGKSSSHSRAVGAAAGANPVVIIAACHRVVASDSKGGFSCGIDRKIWLLDHEIKYK